MLDIQVSEQSGIHRVRLGGELNALEGTRLIDVLGELAVGERGRMSIDLSGLKSIDSAGLSALIHVVTRARLTNGRVALVAPSAFVSGVLSVTRLDRWFDLYASGDEADQFLLQG